MRPTIGITSALPAEEADLGECEVSRHAKLLRALGAATVILPRGRATAEALTKRKLHGILFSGGGDVSTSLYGGRAELSDDRLDLIRDAGELALMRAAFDGRVPTLCVCRGLQLANVALGGTLLEDIKSELGSGYRISHHQALELDKPHTERTHVVRVNQKSLLAEIIEAKIVWTNSMHHQAIRTLAPALMSSARSDDGVIEAVELRAREFFFAGVQWHPESLPEDDVSVRLYTAFIEAARAS